MAATSMDRRGFVAALGTVGAATRMCAAILVAAIVAASAAELGSQERGDGHAVEVAPGLYAMVWPDSGGNVAFLVTDEGVVVVDSGESPAMGQRVVAAVRERTERPIRFVVLTHYHDDHTCGLAAFPPTAVVVAADGLAANSARGRSHDLEAYPRHIERLRKAAEGLRDPGGAEYEAAAERVAEAERALATLETVQPLVPTIEVASALTIHLGQDSVEVLRTGPTHTSCSAVVRFVRQKAVHMGDTVFAGAHPYVDAEAGATTSRWIAFLGEVQTWGVEHIIPGHGPVGGVEELAEQIGYLQELRREVAEARAAGLTCAEAEKAVTMPEYSGYRFADMLPWGVRAVCAELEATRRDP